MKNAGTCLKNGTFGLSLLLLITICLGTAGCSLFKSSAAKAGEDRTLWHSREQRVQIVKQDSVKGGVATQNDHPIVLDSGQIRNGLASLYVRLTENDKSVSVFTGPELDVLSGKLSEGLAQAGPNEDVTFVVIGQRKAVYGLAKQRKVTSGRVFYREGKLNIIFGKMIDDIREHADERYSPLTPGSRTQPVSHKWILEEQPEARYYASGGILRGDWLVLDLATMAAQEAMGNKSVRGAAEESGASPRESVFYENRQAPAAAVKPAKTLEERLIILNELKNKKLITEEEYKAKRSSLLNEL
jgi:hypothetical protein